METIHYPLPLSLVKSRRLAHLAILLALRVPIPAWVSGESAAGLPNLPFANTEAVMRIAADVTPQRFPDADAVLIDSRSATRYEPDGTAASLDESFIKVLTERGRRDYRTRGLRHTLPYDTVEILEAAIIRPDGSRWPIDPERYARDMVEPSQMQANIYNPNSRLLRLTFPGLEIGDLLYLRTLDRTIKPRVPDSWASYAVFEYSIPILHLEYRVEEPDALPLQHLALRDAIGDTVAYRVERIAPDRRRHTWTVTDVPLMFPEPNMPARYTQVQRLLLSTSPDWEHLSRWYWNLSAPRLEAVTDDMRRTVDELIADAPDRDSRIQRLFSYVSSTIRYMGITTEIEAPGYEPRDVGVTFHNRYGVCRDKAAVLVAMLRLANLPAYPVLIHTEARKDEEVPQPYFNHAIVAVAREDGGYELMDPTDETVRERMPAFLGNRSYLVAHPEGESLRLSPVSEAEHNLVRIDTRGELRDDDTLELTTQVAFDGINDQAYRSFFARQAPEVRRRFAEGLVAARLAGAELTDFRLSPEDPTDTDQPLELTLKARVRHYPLLPEDTDEGLIALPWLGDALGYVNFIVGRTGLRSRRYPLETGLACGVEETISIDLSNHGATLANAPAPIEHHITGARFAQSFTSETPERLRAHSRFTIETPEFSPQAYDDLKHLLADIEYAYRRRPRILRASETLADSRLLRADTIVRLDSPSVWTATHRWQREILTFAGAKQHAELKLSYNSGWQSVEWIGATVSNRNGEVHHVVPEEINRMDVGWVGGAPRYPASQTLVVSLPGVQVGSVIDVSFNTSRRDAPFFWLQHSFQGFDPVERARLEIETPLSHPLHLWTHADETLHYSATTNNSAIQHVWQSGPLPRIRTEDRLPPTWSMGPALFVSSATAADYAQAVYARMELAFRTGDAQVTETAERIVGDSASAIKRAQRIRDFVLQHIRLAGPGFTELPLHTFSSAAETLRDGYGHEADRAILMIALLRAAGIPAEPLLTAGDDPRVDSLLAPWLAPVQYGVFNRVLVRVNLDGETYYFNDTSHYAPLEVSAQVGHATLESDGRVGRIERPKRLHDAIRTDWDLNLNAEGTVLATQTTTYYGLAVAAFRQQYLEMTPELRNRHHQELVGGLSRAAEMEGGLSTELTAYPGVRHFSARLPRFAVQDGDRLTLLLPDSPRGLGVRGDQRRNPFHQPSPSHDITTWTIRLPPETRDIPLHPQTQNWSLPDGLGEVRFTVERDTFPDTLQPRLRLEREITIAPGLLPPERYAAWREVHRRMLHPSLGIVQLTLN